MVTEGNTVSMPAGPPPIGEGQPVFFPVSPLKLVVMATVTFGIYELYWFYKNWKLIQQRTGSHIMPFWRAFFGVIWCYPCFREVKDTAESRGVSFPSSPGLLAVVWILLTISYRMPDPYWVICFFSPLVLVPVQVAVNRLNAIVSPNHDPNSRFTGWNIAGLIIGGILFALSMLGTFLPPSP